MSNCKNCGADLHPNAKFCHLCGSKVEIAVEPIPAAVQLVKKQQVEVQNADLYQYVDTSKFVNADYVMAVPPSNDDNKFLNNAFATLVIKDTPADLFDYFEAGELENDYVNVYVMKGFVETTYTARAGIDEKKQVYNSSAGRYETKTVTNWFPVSGDHKYSGTVHAVLGPEEGGCLDSVFCDKVVEMAELYQRNMGYPVGMPEDPTAENVRLLERMLKEDAEKDTYQDIKNSYDRWEKFNASSAIRSKEITVYSIPFKFFRFSYSLSQYQKEKAFWVSAFDVPNTTATGNLPDGLTDIKKLVDKKLHFKITRPLVVNILLSVITIALECVFIAAGSEGEGWAAVLSLIALALGLVYFFVYRKIRINKVNKIRLNATMQKSAQSHEAKEKFFGKEA